MEDSKPVEWAIKEIKELEFMVNESLDVGTTIDTSYTVDMLPVIAEEKIQMSVTFSYLKNETKEVIMKSKVMTTYLIRDLKSMVKKKDNNIEAVDLPHPLWIALFSIAFTHTRAILARSSAGSKYSHMLIPPINPDAEFKKLFGEQLQKEV